MTDEKCANCQKTLSEHWNEGGDLYCSGSPRDLRKWTPTEPQAALFADVHRTTGYEI